MSKATLEQALQVALTHHQAGRLHEAESIYRQILVFQPKHADALHLLGMIAGRVGRYDLATDLIHQAISVAPNNPIYHSNLGNFLRSQGQYDQAIISCRQALALNRDFAEAHNNLGNALQDSGQLDEAMVCYQQALALKPDFPEAHNNLGNALWGKGQFDQALACCERALALNPDLPDAHNNMGNTMRDKGQFDQAIACYQRAIAVKPDYPEAHNNLGNALKDIGQFDEAIECYQRAVAFKPNYSEAHNNLGNALKNKGQLDEAIDSYRRAMDLNPNFVGAYDNLLFALHCHPASDPQSLFAEAQRWNRKHAEPLQRYVQPHSNDRNPNRRLRIGYVSPDFRGHPVGRFILPLLTAHNHDAFRTFCYAQVAAPDTLTAKLQAEADVWRSIVGLSDEQAAEMIRQDQIDILVDLAAHTAKNRLLIFARKPAPVQVTFLGYPGTTGLETIDYRITDALADPPGQTERYHTEQLIRLPQTAWCFAPTDSLPVSPRRNGPITFGCFNNFAKVTEPMLRCWSKILQAVPRSRLLLKASTLGCDSVRHQVLQILNASGIDPNRVELRGFEATHTGHMALYEQIDIALDTFPYHGTTTTCEAVWMGVPVVSLAGATHVSRVGVSLLSSIGLPELVADNPEQYIQIASDLANNLPRLNELRSTLRQRMQASPLMDTKSYAQDIEAAYRTIWRNWCGA